MLAAKPKRKFDRDSRPAHDSRATSTKSKATTRGHHHAAAWGWHFFFGVFVGV